MTAQEQKEVNCRVATVIGLDTELRFEIELNDRGYDEHVVRPPDYCGTWADAGPLLEELIQTGCCPEFGVMEIDGKHQIEITFLKKGFRHYLYADTETEAATLAWLVVFETKEADNVG